MVKVTAATAWEHRVLKGHEVKEGDVRALGFNQFVILFIGMNS